MTKRWFMKAVALAIPGCFIRSDKSECDTDGDSFVVLKYRNGELLGINVFRDENCAVNDAEEYTRNKLRAKSVVWHRLSDGGQAWRVFPAGDKLRPVSLEYARDYLSDKFDFWYKAWTGDGDYGEGFAHGMNAAIGDIDAMIHNGWVQNIDKLREITGR